MTAAFIDIPGLSVTIFRPILGLILVLFIPGYAIMAMLFPGRSGANGFERGILSFAFSVVLTALIGFGLNYTPVGIRFGSIAACMAVVIVGCILIANKKRHELPEDERFSLDGYTIYRGIARYISPDVYRNGGGFSNKALNVIIVVVILLSVGAIAYAVVLPKQGETLTEFYLLGPDGIAGHYPANIVLGNDTQVIVGTVNHEHKNVTYEMVLSLNGTEKDNWRKTDQFTLADNETMEKIVDIQPNATGTNVKWQFLLYKDGDFSTPYKELHLWVNVTAPVNATAIPVVKAPLTVFENLTME